MLPFYLVWNFWYMLLYTVPNKVCMKWNTLLSWPSQPKDDKTCINFVASCLKICFPIRHATQIHVCIAKSLKTMSIDSKIWLYFRMINDTWRENLHAYHYSLKTMIMIVQYVGSVISYFFASAIKFYICSLALLRSLSHLRSHVFCN